MRERGLVDGVCAPVVFPLQAPVRVAKRLTLSCADGKDDARAVSGADDRVPSLGRTAHEVLLPERPLLALDDEQPPRLRARGSFLVGFPVVHRHRLTRGEEPDSVLREVPVTRDACLEPVAPA
jgi:hypothetical protein